MDFHNGTLRNQAYDVITEASLAPMENKPVYRYWPGAQPLSLSRLGCNLTCQFCKNWEIAFRHTYDAAGQEKQSLTAEDATNLAQASQRQAMSWSHNESPIAPIDPVECPLAVRAARLSTIPITNGLLINATLEARGPRIDTYHGDVKRVNVAFYQPIASMDWIGDTERAASRTPQEPSAHVNVVANGIPGFQQSEKSRARVAKGVAMPLDTEMMRRLTTLIPYVRKRQTPTPSLTIQLRTCEIERQSRLRFIFGEYPQAPHGAGAIAPSYGGGAIKRLRGRTTRVGVMPEETRVECGEGLRLLLPSTRGAVAISASADATLAA